MKTVINKKTKIETEILASSILINNYLLLYYIPNFEIRVATSKKRAIETIELKCNCKVCNYAINYINQLNFTKHE